MRVIIKNDHDECSFVGSQLCGLFLKLRVFRPTKTRPFVLGLPTGSTPLGMYRHPIEMVKEGKNILV